MRHKDARVRYSGTDAKVMATGNRQVRPKSAWTSSEGTTRYWMIVDRALIPDSMVIQGSSGSLQMVFHTLIDVPLANVYLDSPYYRAG